MAIPGSIVAAGKLVTPGGAQGPLGGMGPPGPTVVSTDVGNIATLGSDSKIYVPDPTPQITSVRLRSYNSVGNPNMEVCQRYPTGSSLATDGTFVEDRWVNSRSASAWVGSWFRTAGVGNGIVIPGSNYFITSQFVRFTLSTAQASLAAGDYFQLMQIVEGCNFRELANDVHSLQVLVRSSVGPLKFGVSLRDGTASRSLVKLCTITSPNTWTLCQMPNIPVWPGAGSFSMDPGTVGYQLGIGFGAGSTFTTPANDTWQNGNFISAVGQDNFMGKPVNSTFDIAFCQHEPGPLCSTLIDKPFAGVNGNLDECLRYYSKSYDYGLKAGTVYGPGVRMGIATGVATMRLTCPFAKPMAKAPTVICYAPNNGNSFSCFSWEGGDLHAANAGDIGYTGFSSTNDPGNGYVINRPYLFHYTADTLW